MVTDVTATRTDNRVLFEQHWLHCRHIESERAWFMSAYSAITGGILTFVFLNESTRWQPLTFLIILTIIGLAINIRWIQAFEHHRNLISATASSLGIQANVDVPAFWLFRIRYLFPSFYSCILVLLVIVFVIR